MNLLTVILFIVFPKENNRLFPNRTMHVHILRDPFRINVVAVFIHLASIANVISDLQDDICKLQSFFPLIVDGIISQQCAEDIACHRAG